MTALPTKLKYDAIIEAILEVRFASSNILPELLMGRLIDFPAWSKFVQRRLPTADIPDVIRNSDINLRYLPMIELAEVGGNRSIKIGHHAIAFHNKAPYLGWAKFNPALQEMIDLLFNANPEITIQRLGLRYINLLTPSKHFINNINDLNLSVKIGDHILQEKLNLNFHTEEQENTTCMVRVATKEFVEFQPPAELPPDANVLVDIDVYTSKRLKHSSAVEVKSWLEAAHSIEKGAFFKLLKSDTIEGLREV